MESETFHLVTKHKRTFIGLGVTQIAIGVVCFILGVVIVTRQPYTASGIWGGILCCICGGWTISIGTSCRRCNIITGLVMAIIASLLGLVCGILDAVQVGGNSRGILAPLAVLHFIQMVFGITVSVLLACRIKDVRKEDLGSTNHKTTIPAVQQGQKQEDALPTVPDPQAHTKIVTQQEIAGLPALKNEHIYEEIPEDIQLPLRTGILRTINIDVEKQMALPPAPGDKKKHEDLALNELPSKQGVLRAVVVDVGKQTTDLPAPEDEGEHEVHEDLTLTQAPSRQNILRTAADDVKQQGHVVEQNLYLMPEPDVQQGQEQDYVLPPAPEPPVNISITAQKQGQVAEQNLYLMPNPDAQQGQEQDYVLPPAPEPPVNTSIPAQKQGQVAEQNFYLMPIPDAQQCDIVPMPPAPEPPVNTSSTAQKQEQDVEPNTYLIPLPDVTDYDYNYILPPPPVPEVETKSSAQKQKTSGNPPTSALELQNKN